MAYTPRSVRAPRLAGLSLRAFSTLVDMPGIGPLLRAQMLEQVGIPKLRAAAVAGTSPSRPSWLDHGASSPDDAHAHPGRATTAGYAHPSIDDYTEAYRKGTADPVSVAKAVLAARARLDAGDQPLRAFIAMDEGDLIAQAEASAARLRAGTPRSWLEGVPIAVKDELDQAPYPTTVGTSFLGKSPAGADATVVARLRAAGALLVGKTNMHELGIGVTGINPHHGAARNPYDLGRATGGSSSGSAAAAAAGFCPVAIGADGGGSIRIPSALCGMVGLKATFGRVSEHGAAPLCWSVAHVGPIGAHAVDVAAIYALIAGADPHDAGSLGHPGVRLPGAADLSGLRVGVLDSWFEHAEPAVVEACRVLLDNLGATLVRVDLPDPDLVRLAHLVVIVGEMAAAQLPHTSNGGGAPTYGPDTALNFAIARSLSASDYAHALRVRGHLAEGWRHVFDQVDVVATPTTACTAPPIRPDALGGESDIELLDRIMRFAHAPNLFGFPAVSIPAGYDAAGMPIGLQLIGRPWSEDTLLGMAASAAPLVERRRPKVFAELLG
ncbi:MAG: amidase [Pseudomonadota bacterium]|nr:amidase [Pseudomonadota bacterium]